ncbi:MAG TPA: dihydroorotate dehydrogenase electron transfer subunit [Nitrospirae bacterium]|nr:dihydroorotate dehydrogenase B (NAD(+)), electron transfer subunit [bacterium BMS3Abin06]HDH11896.1 dihydroorotate dehydrogenase electron transfer subunit [Nitrospirota bacterium]HDZ02762.1 dihydroorotate dehydrogenase electron transfer subunit [Nitrospirota bacterium]
MSRLFKASVSENKELIKNHYLLTLNPLKKIKKPEPGQFFMLSVDKGLDPLLKRPLSIHRLTGGNLQFLYRVVGSGTNILSEKKTGDILELIGPLGKGFPFKKTQKNIILVAGGLGIAPIFALAETLAKIPPPAPPVLLFQGARTEDEVLCIDKLKSIGIDPIISTDNGTLGEKGNIVSVLKKYLTRHSLPVNRYILYACGPEPMLKSLSSLAIKHKLKGYIALEQHMACGLGTCLGCVVNTIDGYKRVCKEGPVFPIEKIVW